MLPSGESPPSPSGSRRYLLGDVLALSVSVGWFVFNATLPDAYAGRLCCDSLD